MTNRRDFAVNVLALAGLGLLCAGIYEQFGWPLVAILLGLVLLGSAFVAASK